jgi:hypothetical protein
MTTDYKFTELFCIIDEFCKHFDAENARLLLEDNSGMKRRRRAASLSDSEIMTVLLYFHFGTFRNFKQPLSANSLPYKRLARTLNILGSLSLTLALVSTNAIFSPLSLHAR